MARIAGIDLPREKRVEIGLTYIYGIGRPSATKICAQANVNPDTRVRELTDDEVKKIAAIAEAHYIALCPHNPSGPVANAATLQLAACIPNFHLLETMANDVPWRKDISDEYVEFKDGLMSIGSKPGLGIELNESEIAKHPYEPHGLRHYKGTLTDIRPKSAYETYFK